MNPFKALFLASVLAVALCMDDEEDGPNPLPALFGGGLSDDSDDSDEKSGRCDKACKSQLNRKIKSTLSIKDVDKPSALVEEFTADKVEQMCEMFSEAQSAESGCFAKCPSFSSNKTTPVLHFVCVERTEDVKKYMPCYEKVRSGDDTDSCNLGCVGPLLAGGLLTKMPKDRDVQSGNLGGLLDFMGSACQMMDCMLECLAKNVDVQCGEDAEGAKELMHDFARAAVDDGMGEFFSLGPQVVPAQCRKLHGDPVDDMPISGSANSESELHIQVMNKEMEVLDKEQHKLDLEIEKLGLEKQLIEKQLNN
jgi:hypothetical protein